MSNNLKSERGVTIIETIIVTLLVGIVISLMMGMLSLLLTNYQKISQKMDDLEAVKMTVAFVEQEIRRAKHVSVKTRQDGGEELLTDIIFDEGCSNTRRIRVIKDKELPSVKFYYSVKGNDVSISEMSGKIYVKREENTIFLVRVMQDEKNKVEKYYYRLPLRYKGDEIDERKTICRN